MHCKALVVGLAISASTIIMADPDTDWQCLTNAINASFDLNPSNRTDMQQIAFVGKCWRMRNAAATELVAPNREALFACLDDIGTYVLFPTNAYLDEIAVAKTEYLAFQATNTYPRTPGSVRSPWSFKHIEGTGWFGNAVYHRWEPVLSRNNQIETYRRKVLTAFRPAVQRHLSSMPGEMRPAFRTNVMERASLSVREVEILFTQ